MCMINYGKHSINNKDIQEVIKTLKSDFITQGNTIITFEKKLADYCGAKYAVAVSNGTAALHLSCIALGLKQGDYYWTSPLSFVASSNCGIYCSSIPDFVDIDRKTFNISIECLEEKLKIAKKNNKIPKVIIPIHFAGLPCEMDKIYSLSKEYGFKILEDGCHALGSSYKYCNKWYKIGSCKHSDITVFSFHPVKSITTGEGGAILTNSKEIYEKLLMLRSHGITKDSSKFTNPSIRQSVNSLIINNSALCTLHSALDQPWYYEMQELGFNYRITDIQSALGISQLNRIDSFMKKRQEIANIYQKELNTYYKYQKYNPKTKKSANHLFVILSKNRDKLFNDLKQNGINCQIHYIPIYRQPYYQKLLKDFDISKFSNTEYYYKRCLSIPIFYDLKKSEQNKIINNLVNLVNPGLTY